MKFEDPVKRILICGMPINNHVAEMLTALDTLHIIDEVKKHQPLEIKLYPREELTISLITLKEHGEYRKFEKLDKRKNFRR
jgi:hypothetical protein